jgi:hypothetical protein
MMLLALILACSGDRTDDAPSGGDSADPSVGPTVDSGHTGSIGPTGTSPDPCREGALAYEPAVGSYEVVPLEEGDVLTVIQGPQGGYHVDFAGVASPVPDVGIIVRPLVTLDDGTILAGEDDVVQAAFADYDPDTCSGSFIGVRMFVLSDAATLCSHEGQAATVDLVVEDFDGRSTSVSLGVTIGIDLLEPYDCQSLP